MVNGCDARGRESEGGTAISCKVKETSHVDNNNLKPKPWRVP